MVPLGLLRPYCLALPGVSERLSHGEPAWFAGRPNFAMYLERHHDDRLACWLAAPPGAQSDWVAREPAQFFVPPYVGGRGWLGCWLDRGPNWPLIGDLVEQAYRCVASPRLIAQLDG